MKVIQANPMADSEQRDAYGSVAQCVRSGERLFA